ncbi:MAG: serine--tRNA ligase [Elusimicrobia bacterium]|nr:serine--tRNA ligase [Elusimicrobiota bacterium]
MLDINIIREDKDGVIKELSRRGGDFSKDIEKIYFLDKSWRELLKKSDALKAERNSVSTEIGKLKREKKSADEKIAAMQIISEKIKELDAGIREVRTELKSALLLVPNLIEKDTPYENTVLREEGEVKDLGFPAKTHWEIGEDLGILDFEAAVSLSGSRFALLKGLGCNLERGLANFMLDTHTSKHGYTEIMPPILVREDVMVGTGQLPKFRDDMYALDDGSMFLIPTSEVPLCNLVREKITDASELPLKFTALTSCFRRESGSYGRDTKGLIRNHQFNKVELVNIASPEESEEMHEKLLEESEEILKLLGLTYRVLLLGSSDTGFSAAKTYDLEVWMPGEKLWREVSSCSNCLDFQARRMDARTRGKDSSTVYLHTLNSSGLAVGRIFAAVLENYQRADGSVAIPEVLQAYMGDKKEIKKNTR